jgi:hypothetical protein
VPLANVVGKHLEKQFSTCQSQAAGVLQLSPPGFFSDQASSSTSRRRCQVEDDDTLVVYMRLREIGLGQKEKRNSLYKPSTGRASLRLYHVHPHLQIDTSRRGNRAHCWHREEGGTDQ